MEMMKKFLLGTVGLLALGIAAPASAADMPRKAPPPVPYVAPIYDWTGFTSVATAVGARAATVWISLM
jgi:outer membrane immunogenic protein